jgi:nitrogen PTS system EIIA component
MDVSTRTPEGLPSRCPICGKDVIINPSLPPGDAPCPHCGSLLWCTLGHSPILDPLIAQVGFVHFRAALPDLKAMNKAAVFRMLIKSLIVADEIPREDEDGVVDSLLKREQIGSTGIGRGVAVPHATNPAVSRLTGVFARSQDGIDFDSRDGEPVHRLVLLLSPSDRPGEHLRALESISRLLRAG